MLLLLITEFGAVPKFVPKDMVSLTISSPRESQSQSNLQPACLTESHATVPVKSRGSSERPEGRWEGGGICNSTVSLQKGNESTFKARKERIQYRPQPISVTQTQRHRL